MNRLKILLFGFLLGLLPQFVFAQGTLNALSFSPPGIEVSGNGINGFGWSFVPTSDLLITAISSTAPQVSFWMANGQVIGNYDYSGPYGSFFTGPPTTFQSIPSLLLSAGQTYSISTQFANFTTRVNSFGFSLNGIGELMPFTTSPYISQFASYVISPSGQWSLPPVFPPLDNANSAFLGPNFQFEVAPEPTSFELFVLAICVCAFQRTRLKSRLNP